MHDSSTQIHAVLNALLMSMLQLLDRMEGIIARSARAEVSAATPAPALLSAPEGEVGISSQWHVELGASLVTGDRSGQWLFIQSIPRASTKVGR